MSKKTIGMALLALVAGVVIGGVSLAGVRADEVDGESKIFSVPPIFEPYIDEDEAAQLKEDFNEFHQNMSQRRDLMERVNRETTKTEDGIQINLSWEDSEDVAKAHELYDENGGEWEGMHGMKGGFGFRKGGHFFEGLSESTE